MYSAVAYRIVTKRKVNILNDSVSHLIESLSVLNKYLCHSPIQPNYVNISTSVVDVDYIALNE